MLPWCKQAIYAPIDYQQIASAKMIQLLWKSCSCAHRQKCGIEREENILNENWTWTYIQIHCSLSHKKWKEDQQLETHLIWITLTQTNTFDLSYQQANETNSPHSITHWGCNGDEWVVLYAFTNSFTFIYTSLSISCRFSFQLSPRS